MNLAPRFDHPVPPGGYAWWYVDALSDDDGRHGLAIIAFVGSVFSPYYALARRRGPAEPMNHCAFNVGLYLPACRYWTMTERPVGSTRRSAAALAIGPSAMHWDGRQLRIDVDEIAVPLPARVRGTILLRPMATLDRDFALEPGGAHRWRPLAPRAEVEVDLASPPLRWRGTGYFDSNVGDTPLEQAFHRWQWTRAHLANGVTAIGYDAVARARAATPGTRTRLSLRIKDGTVAVSEQPAAHTVLPGTLWGLERGVAVDEGTPVRILRDLESGPFYARSLLDVTMQGSRALAVHETLSLDRFAAGWVRAMLPFRMPRAPGPRPNARAGSDA
jgi:carotenoid 1,2-hydratase